MEVRWAEKRWFLEGLLREVERKKEGLSGYKAEASRSSSPNSRLDDSSTKML
ncbi:hypothetical protein QJS10_CPA01g01551 [Acorus calamus]|uniref:Uncharacterized protein n=1 Tax=Acorus calamus TaxID=4465 RepID=A0AAV9FK69_ACOCL|nr:hypothetical protein QJS10_CPA01g01551 [Acorus calamus]